MNNQTTLFNWSDVPDPQRTRADQIFKDFRAYHKTHPLVWKEFVRIAFLEINKGRKKFSSKAICERIRWENAAPTTGGNLNNFTPYYARLFHVAVPENNDFFILRKLISADKPAYKNVKFLHHILGEDFTCLSDQYEDELNVKLKKLYDETEI